MEEGVRRRIDKKRKRKSALSGNALCSFLFLVGFFVFIFILCMSHFDWMKEFGSYTRKY